MSFLQKQQDAKEIDTDIQLFETWVNKLGLNDWAIRFVPNCTPDEMYLQDSCGCASYVESTKSATIQILDEKYYTNDIRPYNFEQILVHELLHLKLCFYCDNDNTTDSRLMHQIIDDLARAFVDD